MFAIDDGPIVFLTRPHDRPMLSNRPETGPDNVRIGVGCSFKCLSVCDSRDHVRYFFPEFAIHSLALSMMKENVFVLATIV